ncbi:MAG: histidine kinase [Sphingomicrobium sp.]
MVRFVAGAAACFLLLTGAFLLWQGRALAPMLPAAPLAAAGTPSMIARPVPLEAPEATPKTREQQRFARADKDKNGRIDREDVLGARRKAFAKLDSNGNGALAFDEWAVKTLDKFAGADKDRTGWLTPAEYATTAPPPPKKKPKCGC